MDALLQQLEAFINYLKFEKRFSENTLSAYHADLTQFFDFLSVQYPDTKLPNVDAFMIKSWIASLKENKLPKTHSATSNKSIHRKISSLKSFYKYLLRENVVAQTPLAAIVLPKINKRLPSFLKEKEAQQLIEPKKIEEGKKYWEQRTEQLIVKLFYETGIRLSELVNLKESNFDASYRQIKVTGKGNKERIIPLSQDMLRDMQLYLSEKPCKIAGVDNFFVSEKGKALYAKKVYNAVKSQMSDNGILLKKKSPHVLRHTFATHLMNNGADMNAVKELLGHTSLAATQVYTHTGIEQLKEVYRKAHPKAT